MRFMHAIVGIVVLAALPAAGRAEPGGCLKYGAAGAVIGHAAGHGAKAAIIGCAAGLVVRRHAMKRDANDLVTTGPHGAMLTPR